MTLFRTLYEGSCPSKQRRVRRLSTKCKEKSGKNEEGTSPNTGHEKAEPNLEVYQRPACKEYCSMKNVFVEEARIEPRETMHRIASMVCVNGVKLLMKRIAGGIPSNGHMTPRVRTILARVGLRIRNDQRT